MEHYTKAMKLYFTIENRATRSDFWYFTLVSILVGALFGLIGAIIDMPTIVFLGTLIHFIPSITLFIRRLHDIDLSGWWFLVLLVPIAGFIFFFYATLKDSTDDNPFGNNPKGF